MKKTIFLFVSILAAALMSASCEQTKDIEESKGEGGLTIEISDSVLTKANTADEEDEAALNTLNVAIFQGNAFYGWYSKSDFTFSGGTGTKTFAKVPVATYTVLVVANGPSDITSLTTMSAIRSKAITLANCSSSNGYVMAGEAQASVTNGGSATAAVTLNRHAARVRLIKVTNSVPSGYNPTTISVKGVFLENVNSAWTVKADANATTFTNLAGRSAGNSNSTNTEHYIKNASMLQYACTGVFPSSAVSIARGSNNQPNWRTYCFPVYNVNKSNDQTGPISSASGVLARFVVLATVNGADYYYPVTLVKDNATLMRNYTYDVDLTISGTGSTDPNVPVERGALTATVTVTDWTTGATYTETI